MTVSAEQQFIVSTVATIAEIKTELGGKRTGAFTMLNALTVVGGVTASASVIGAEVSVSLYTLSGSLIETLFSGSVNLSGGSQLTFEDMLGEPMIWIVDTVGELMIVVDVSGGTPVVAATMDQQFTVQQAQVVESAAIAAAELPPLPLTVTAEEAAQAELAAGQSYAGRTVDLLIFQGVEAEGEQQADLSWGSAGMVVTGIQKVSQTFTTVLLTDRGSLEYDPDMGTGLLQAIRTGAIRTESDVQTEFSLAVSEVNSYLRNIQTSLPTDEQFESATLISFSMEHPNLILYVRLRSVAGETRQVILPIPVAIR